MATDVASADAEQRPESDFSPKAPEETPEGTAATGTTATGGGTLGERQVQGKAASSGAAVGAADDPAERKADEAADQVLRMPDPVAVEPVPAAPGPPVQRKEGSSDEQRLPGAAPATPATPGSATPGLAAPSGAAPETTTPAGVAAGASAPEAGIPEPAAEPPAPEGEQPARETPRVPPEVQEYLDASRGKGAPLPEKARRMFETRFQRPLDDVRLHDDGSADDAARKLDALAFTRGNDIYFRAGAYDPESQEGQKLLAHELAHVVQQRPGVNRRLHRKPAPGLGGQVIRRKPPKDAGNKAKDEAPSGTINLSEKKIEIDKLKVPSFKADKKKGPYILRKGTREENPTQQGSKWRSYVKKGAEDAVTTRITTLKGEAGVTQTGDPAWYLKLGALEHYFVGTPSSIGNDNRVPPFDQEGQLRDFDIDHQHEAQLGGPDIPENMWLLDRVANQAAGRTIYRNINATLREFLQKTAPAQIDPSKVPSESEARKDWTVEFKALEGDGENVKAVTWLSTDIGAKLMQHAKLADTKTVERLRGSKDELKLYERTSGGRVQPLKRTGDESKISGWKTPLFEFESVSFTESNAAGNGQGRLEGVAFKNNSTFETAPFKVPIKPLKGVPWGGVVAPGSIEFWRMRALSPLVFPELEFDLTKGFVGRGVLPKPSIKLLEDIELAVVIDGNVRLEAVIYAGDLKLPGPFKVTGGSFILGVGTGGVTVEGRIDFEIEKLAKGYVQAAAGMKRGGPTVALEGRLDFDTKMFTKAALGLSYKGGKWGVTGELEVGPGKIKGIKRAAAKVEVLDETITAVGEFEPSLKGVDKGTVGFRYNEATGAEITGEILFGSGVPGVKSGKLAATIRQGKEGYSLSGAVTVEPAVPGLTGAITGSYEDGGFLVEAELGYERGRAKGTVKIGVTNQPVGADGKPAGPPNPDGALIAYGGGSVTLTITPWLQGTVGLQLKPNGEIEVTGAVRLPSSFEVFPEKRVERQIFSIGIDIPIIGVAVAGQRIGIFATIRGGMSITAGFGPGQLRDVGLTVTYNPDHPDDTTVTGSGTFYVPAAAALRLTVDGGLGAGIPIVSATAGVSVYGEIGVAGAASAGAAISWTPIAGIVMDARGEIFVEPKFKFGIDAFVDVSADLWITTIELYQKKWSLASFEYGSNLRFGLMFPLHYESGKPFDLSFDQIQWTYPQIEPGELLGGLMKQLVG
jgi:hypothetical protein